MVTRFTDLAFEVYPSYSLKLPLWGLKHVRVTALINWC